MKELKDVQEQDAEIERLRTLNAELRAALVECMRDAIKLIDTVHAENERLLAALGAVTEVEPEYDYDWGMECIEIAQRALDAK